MNKFLIFILITSTLLANGCSRGLFSVHKLDIQQGNALNAEDIVQIKAGLSRKEVQAILGYPIVDPLFQPDRWDYVYHRKLPDTPVEQRHISIYFKDDVIVQIKTADPDVK